MSTQDGPWYLLSPTRVLHYVADKEALKCLVTMTGIPFKEFQRLAQILVKSGAGALAFALGLAMHCHPGSNHALQWPFYPQVGNAHGWRSYRGEKKTINTKSARNWILLEQVKWIQHVQSGQIAHVGGDADFFVGNIACTQSSMHFFKAGRLKKFVNRQLWNSGKQVEEYMPKGGKDKWILIPQSANALNLIVQMQPPSEFALPQAAGSANNSDIGAVGKESTAAGNAGIGQAQLGQLARAELAHFEQARRGPFERSPPRAICC